MTDWSLVDLGDVIDFFDSRRVPLSGMERATRQGAFPYYGASGVIDWIDGYIFDGRFLLIAEDGENLNSRKLPIAFFAEGRFWVNNHAHIVRGKAGILDDVFLQQWFAQADIGGYVTGAAQPKLSQASMRRIQLLLPPLPIQRKIASVLSAYDDLIENNYRRIKLLEETAQRVYREWFVDFRYPGHEGVPSVDSELGPIPDGWHVSPVGEVTPILGGGTPTKTVAKYWENGSVVWYTPTDLTSADAMFISGSRTRITEEGLARSSAKLFPAGSVMMTSRATIGVVAITTVAAATNQGFIICPTSEDVGRFHLYFWLHEHRELIGSLASGATFKEINKATFRQIPFLVADARIESAFEDWIDPIGREIQNLLRSQRSLRATRELLLPRLISGEIDVSNLELAMPGAAA